MFGLLVFNINIAIQRMVNIQRIASCIITRKYDPNFSWSRRVALATDYGDTAGKIKKYISYMSLP